MVFLNVGFLLVSLAGKLCRLCEVSATTGSSTVDASWASEFKVASDIWTGSSISSNGDALSI